MSEDQYLTHPAANLARRAPEEWAEFKKAFRAYENAIRDALVRAGSGDLARSQGMAQQCAALGRIYEDAIAASDRMATKQQAMRTR